MKEEEDIKPTVNAIAKQTEDSLYDTVRGIVLDSRKHAYHAVNSTMVQSYWSIGKAIVEVEQAGSEKAEYGEGTLNRLSKRLVAEFGRGFSARNLRNMRQFYILYPIWQTVSAKLSWSHYCCLMRVSDDTARAWYMSEAIQEQWSSRQLDRQISTLYYERLLMSGNKDSVIEEARDKLSKVTPDEVIKDPYVLEFLDITPPPGFYEEQLEQALIDQLQDFLLELGRGFSFVARQKHLNLGGEHFYIDLVFYNYILKCFVLIDLKTGKLTHQDVGQMDTYIRVFDDLQKNEDDNPTIGIVLCSEKNETIAKYSILNDSKQIYASKYQFTLPTVEELETYISDERRRFEEREDFNES